MEVQLRGLRVLARAAVELACALGATAAIVTGLVAGTAAADPAEAPAAAGPEEAAGLAERNYPIGPGDVLRIVVFGEPGLSGDFPVDSEGRIVYPLLGGLAVGGEPVGALHEKLTRLLAADYLHEPQVSVTVKEYRSQKVRLLGNVGKPGIYYLDSPTRLFDLLSRAEGVAPRLGEIRRGQMAHIVREHRDGNGNGTGTNRAGAKTEKIYVDLYELLTLGREDMNLLLADGDVIYVPERESVHVVGEVKKPGTYDYEGGMTLLKAITLAGGATKKASVKNAVIKRIIDGKEVQIKAKAEDLLQPDDIVEVPLSFW